MKIPEKVQNTLTEILGKEAAVEMLESIKKEFDTQVQIQVESACHEYDAEAIKRVESLTSIMDESYTIKASNAFKKLKERYDNTILALKENYDKKLLKEAANFKDALQTNIEKYIDRRITTILPYETIKEASKNNTAYEVLKGVRSVLAVNTALMSESVRQPILEQEERTKRALKVIKRLKHDNEVLREANEANEAKIMLENKIASSALTKNAADHLRLVFENKSPKFIAENFNYTLELHKSNETKRVDNLRKSTMNKALNSKSRLAQQKVNKSLIKESSQSHTNSHDLLMEDVLNDID